MSDKKEGGFPIHIIFWMVLLYAGYRIVEAIVNAITILVDGLVIIALITAGILAAYWLYRYITDKQFGETKNLREIEKLERERKLYISRLPQHLRQGANEYYKEKQSEFFNPRPQSRLDVFFDRTKQAMSTFQKKEK
jgi:hypothetical protein